MIKRKEFIVIVERNNQDILYNWIDKYRHLLVFISENKGCGCCVDIFEIEGEAEIVKTFPNEIL
ncbi:hypothetical protein ABW636_09735 [Aquimarina sp. 2201CG1-2-11]|uniref:hypothetical protein n=1 Tax=Aquimarina discodermiae TaxID=3231043 RepID=UPI0034635B73